MNHPATITAPPHGGLQPASAGVVRDWHTRCSVRCAHVFPVRRYFRAHSARCGIQAQVRECMNLLPSGLGRRDEEIHGKVLGLHAAENQLTNKISNV